MQVKGFMPPKDGLSRETPTGRAVGRNVVWHNFLCCSGICYAFGTILSELPCIKKIENVPWQLSPIKHSRFCVF